MPAVVLPGDVGVPGAVWKRRERLPNGVELWAVRGAHSVHWVAVDPRAKLPSPVGYERGSINVPFTTDPDVGGWVYDARLPGDRKTNYAMVQGADAPCRTFTAWRDAIAHLNVPRPSAEGQQQLLEAA